jgi:hypothetical protein
VVQLELGLVFGLVLESTYPGFEIGPWQLQPVPAWSMQQVEVAGPFWREEPQAS